MILQKQKIHLGKSIQEWTKQILWKPALKKFQGISACVSLIF